MNQNQDAIFNFKKRKEVPDGLIPQSELSLRPVPTTLYTSEGQKRIRPPAARILGSSIFQLLNSHRAPKLEYLLNSSTRIEVSNCQSPTDALQSLKSNADWGKASFEYVLAGQIPHSRLRFQSIQAKGTSIGSSDRRESNYGGRIRRFLGRTLGKGEQISRFTRQDGSSAEGRERQPPKRHIKHRSLPNQAPFLGTL